MNAVLENYCAENGIALELTVPYTPEQNGVAKCSNRRILDKGRTLLKDINAPDFLWADAFATAVYAINRTVSSSAGDTTPYEAFFRWRPDVSGMRVWFSDVFVHHLKNLGSKKLGEWGHCIKFLGYPHNSSGYRTYNPVSHKVDVIHAPIFHEEACPCPSATFKSSVSKPDDNDKPAAAGVPPE